jgi:hypothetical protein
MILPLQPFRKLSSFFTCFFSGLLIIISLCGCPYNSPFKIDSEPQFAVDDTYLGFWQTTMIDENGKQREIKMNLNKKNDFEYAIYFAGFFGRVNRKNIPQRDTIRGTAFMSLVLNRQFLNISIERNVYITEFNYKNDQISLLPLNDHFTNFIIKSDDELRNRIAFHYKTRLFPLYEESFCLKNMKRVDENP